MSDIYSSDDSEWIADLQNRVDKLEGDLGVALDEIDALLKERDRTEAALRELSREMHEKRRFHWVDHLLLLASDLGLYREPQQAEKAEKAEESK